MLFTRTACTHTSFAALLAALRQHSSSMNKISCCAVHTHTQIRTSNVLDVGFDRELVLALTKSDTHC
jgi:hypothetical protein